MSTYKNSVKLPAVGHLRAQSLASTASGQTTGLWELATKCRAYVAFCQAATLSAGTATFQFYGASDADGTTPAALGGTLVLTAAGQVGVLELPLTLVTAAKPYISIVCTTASGTGICGAVIAAVDPSFSG